MGAIYLIMPSTSFLVPPGGLPGDGSSHLVKKSERKNGREGWGNSRRKDSKREAKRRQMQLLSGLMAVKIAGRLAWVCA
jgi:hypothetical protein